MGQNSIPNSMILCPIYKYLNLMFALFEDRYTLKMSKYSTSFFWKISWLEPSANEHTRDIYSRKKQHEMWLNHNFLEGLSLQSIDWMPKNSLTKY